MYGFILGLYIIIDEDGLLNRLLIAEFKSMNAVGNNPYLLRKIGGNEKKKKKKPPNTCKEKSFAQN